MTMNKIRISDLEEEIIVLKVQGACTISELPSKVPTEGARYHLFRFKHTYEGDSFESNGEDAGDLQR